MKDVTQLVLPEIRELLAQHDRDGLNRALAEVHPADIADIIANLDDQEAATVFRSLTEAQRVTTFEHLEEDDQLRTLTALGRDSMIKIIDEMSADDRADFIQSLPERTSESLLPLMAQAERNDVRRLAAYEEGTAGAVMTTEYATVPSDIAVGETLQMLRKIAPDAETIYYVFITDKDRHLLGYTTLRELVLARPSQSIMEVRRHPLISMPVDADQEDVARTIQHYDLLALPIVDPENRLVGIITQDDVFDVIQEENTEDAQRMGAVEPLEDPYLKAGFWHMAWRRGAWLTILFLGEMFTATALKHYEDTLSGIMSLIFFIPLIVSAGGNSGSQSATLVIRSMALGEVRLGDWFRIMRREISMGLALGLLLGGLGYVRALVWDTGHLVATVVSITLVAVVMVGALAGGLLPLLFKLCRVDPGIASSPFIASVIDIVGIVIYMNVALAVIEMGAP